MWPRRRDFRSSHQQKIRTACIGCLDLDVRHTTSKNAMNSMRTYVAEKRKDRAHHEYKSRLVSSIAYTAELTAQKNGPWNTVCVYIKPREKRTNLQTPYMLHGRHPGAQTATRRAKSICKALSATLQITPQRFNVRAKALSARCPFTGRPLAGWP